MSFLLKGWIFVIFLQILFGHQRVESQNRQALPAGSENLAGLSGLDVGILREIAAALNIPGLSQPLAAENAPSGNVNPTQSTYYQSAPQTGTQTDTIMFSGGMVSPSCTGKGGFFPDYTQGCRVYYRCSPDGRMARFECPLNYIFSEQLKKCDVPEVVTCGMNSQKTVHTPFVNHQNAHSGGAPHVWPTLTHNENGGGFYESLLGAVTERVEGFDQPAVKIMGDPNAVLDMDPAICFGRPSMYIADPDTGCRGYIKCAASHTTPFQTFICPSGMRFDVKSEQCLPRGQVRCADVEPLLPPGFGLAGVGAGAGFDIVPRSGLANPRLTTVAAAAMSQAKQHGGPCHGKTGFVPDYQQQCQVYFYCNADGTSLNLTCPAEMVFNPALQSCDFFQTAPECRAPMPTPQKMKPVEQAPAKPNDPSKTLVLTMTNEQLARTVTSPPLLTVASSKRSNPGVELKYARKTPSLLTMEHPNDAVRHNSHDRRSKLSPQSNPTVNTAFLEGFLTPEAALPVRHGSYSNNINTGNTAKSALVVHPHPAPTQPAMDNGPRRHFPPAAGSSTPPTMYEVECDGSQGYFVEPESGCRIFHFCHPNMTLDTYSCPPTEVFVIRAKSCVPVGAAICIDPISNDARDVLQRIWNSPVVAPVPSSPVVASTVPPLDVSTGESGAQSTPASTLESLCAAGVPGTFADLNSNCAKYIECQAGGTFVIHSCPMNLRFNANLKACDWPQYVDMRCNEMKMGQ